MFQVPSISDKRRAWPFALWLTIGGCIFAIGYWYLSSPALRTFHGHKDGVSSLAFSPDGTFLVSGSYDTAVKAWDLRHDGAETTISQNPGTVTSIAFAPDGKILVVATDENETDSWNEAGQISSVGHSAKGGARARLLEFPSGKLKGTLGGHTLSVSFVSFVANGRFIATQADGGEIKLWDPATCKEVRTPESAMGVGKTLVAFSPDAKLMAVVDRHDVKIIDFTSGKERFGLKGHTDQVVCLTFSPDSKLLATASHDETVRLWDVERGLPKASFSCHQRFAEVVQFSPDGKVLAAGSREIPGEIFLQANGRVTFWDVKAEKELVSHAAHRRGIISIAFSPRGDLLATGGYDGAIRLWKVPERN